jgi:lysophospholipase L1-like esterase
VVFAALLSLLVLVLAEITARVFFGLRDAMRSVDPRSGADAYAGSPWTERYFKELGEADEAAWRPYVQWRMRPFSGQFININDQGLRRTWQSPACSPSSTAVFVFGGSTVWGTGARDEFTLPSALSRALADSARPLCVTNFGQPGYVSSQELIALAMEVRNGARPQLVVFYDGDNDAYAAMQTGVAGVPQNEEHRRQEFNLSARPADMFGLALQRLVTHSGLYRLAETVGDKVLVRSPRRTAIMSRDQGGDDLPQRTVAVYMENVRLIETLSRTYGFRTFFYWQPLVFDKRHLSPDETAEARGNETFARFWRRVRTALKAEPALAADANFSDLGGLFADRPDPLFIDFAHVSEQGNTLIAERIARDVRAALR